APFMRWESQIWIAVWNSWYRPHLSGRFGCLLRESQLKLNRGDSFRFIGKAPLWRVFHSCECGPRMRTSIGHSDAWLARGMHVGSRFPHCLLREIIDCATRPLRERDMRFPAEEVLGFRNVQADAIDFSGSARNILWLNGV